MSQKLKHLLDIKSLTKDQFLSLLESAKSFIEVGDRDVKKVPALRGKTVMNIFYESSTRTRVSFELAAKRLSADAINISSSGSSTDKGETLLDTVRNIQAMGPELVVIRHKDSGSPHMLSKMVQNVGFINAGDGTHEHPSQGLLDCLTLSEYFEKKGTTFSGKKIAIVGDIMHSRVARSNIWANILLGNHVTLVAPPTLMPYEAKAAFGDKVEVTHSISGIKDADIVMVLRMQLERMSSFFVPNLEEYCNLFCLTEDRLKQYAPDAVVMHPGPMNRGIEISTEVADGPRSVILRQVTLGVASRMAILYNLCLGAAGNISEV